MNTVYKHNILVKILFLFFVVFVFLGYVQTAYGAIPVTVVGGPGSQAQIKTANHAQNIEDSNAEIEETLKEFVDKELNKDKTATRAAQEALLQQTQDMVDWIGSGFVEKNGNSSPLFITNI